MFIKYLQHPELFVNAAPSWIGIGATIEEAQASACYWPNQEPHTIVVLYDKAPLWAKIEAEERIHYEHCELCGKPMFKSNGSPSLGHAVGDRCRIGEVG